ncbi:hypothetical protein H2248_003071 [Termitomyces sp. 'cryptogamus']|nr:hypothetical protein H2248_003071 [Termitomyces sp. 'cryptogamus']
MTLIEEFELERPNATIAGISSLAAQCPDIKKIQLTVDATKLAILSNGGKEHLVSLQFGYSPIKKGDASLIASALRATFLSQRFYLSTDDPSFDPDDDSPWSKVGRLTMCENLRNRKRYWRRVPRSQSIE